MTGDEQDPMTATPRDHEAERAVLAAVMQGVEPADLDLTPDSFDDPDHQSIWQAAYRLRATGQPVTPVTLWDALNSKGLHLDAKEGRLYLAGLLGAGLAVNAKYHADIVKRHAVNRHTLAFGRLIAQDIAEGRDPARHVAEMVKAREGGTPLRDRAKPAGDFIFSVSARPAAWWGQGSEVLGAAGESLVIAGPQGTGKSTLGQQLALGRAGLTDYAELLRFPVTPDPRGVLYLACDRSPQVARSMRRMIPETARDIVNQRMDIWIGPLPQLLNNDPLVLVKLGRMFGRGTIIVDSIKDVARDTKEDDGGSAYNLARQHTLAEGFELIELHHTIKKRQDTKPNVDSVYGSTWITAGAGSVLLLDGQPGDAVVKAYHVKQPMDDVGPLTLEHDNRTGRTRRGFSVDLVQAARGRNGITNKDAADILFSATDSNHRKKAERKLDGLVKSGRLTKIPGDDRTATPNIWVAADPPADPPGLFEPADPPADPPGPPGRSLHLVPDKG